MERDLSIFHEQDAEDSLLDSPPKPTQEKAQSVRTERHPSSSRPTYEQQQAREEELRRELESVRNVNDAIEGVIESLGKAKDNMKVGLPTFLSRAVVPD